MESAVMESVDIETVDIESVDIELGVCVDTEFTDRIEVEFEKPVREAVDTEFSEAVDRELRELIDTEAVNEEAVHRDFGEHVERLSEDLFNVPVTSGPSLISQIDSSGDTQVNVSYGSPLVVEIDASHFFKTEQAFNSREEVLDWAKKTGREHGVVVIVRRSDVSDPKRAPRVILACERSCSYRSKENTTHTDAKRRRLGTKKCDCPFTLKVSLLNKDEGKWGLQVVNGIHNHALGAKFEGHSFMGRLGKDEEEILLEMSKSGVRPREILSQLKTRDPTNASTIRTVYNARSKLRMAQTAAWTHLQQLLKLLTEYGYVERHQYAPSTGRVQNLFWAHPTSIQLAKTFPFVFMMDYTNKKNKYCLPLLQIVGVTSTDKTFAVAFVYMKSEKEENYVWALECFKSLFHNVPLPRVIVTDLDLTLMKAVKQVFPDTQNLLCHAHIGKNVLTNCIKSFANEEDCNKFLLLWTDVMHSSSEGEYKKTLYELQTEFCDYPMALAYIHDTWLFNHRTQFVSAWIDQYFHLGNTSTNRAESSHAKLKLHLNSSVQELVNSFNAINLLLELQITEIKLSFEDSLTQIPHRFRDPFYNNLIGIVSTAALEKIEVETTVADSLGSRMIEVEAAAVDSLVDNLDTCSHKALNTLGLPCAHMIVQYRREGLAIPLSDIHSFWKKLTIKSHVEENTHEITIEAEVDMLHKTFLAATRPQKLEIKKQLQRICNPSGTCLWELRKLSELQSKHGGKKRRHSRRYCG